MSIIRKGYEFAKNIHDEVPYRLFNGRALGPLKVIWELTYK